MSRKDFINRVVKSLIDKYGNTVTFKNEATRSVNSQTGAVSRTYVVASARALVEPANLKRDFVYDLSFIAANKNFTYGGAFDAELILLTVRRAALPSGFEVTDKTLVIIRNKVYIIRTLETDQADLHFYRILVKRTEQLDIGQVTVTGNPAVMRFVTV